MNNALPMSGDKCGVKNTKVFKGIIGQVEACKKLDFFANAHSQETPFPTMLFSGSQGLGKSYMAQKVAEALGRDLVEINCANVETVEELFEIFSKKVISDWHKTILFDESHKLSQEITTFLLSMLNPNKSQKNEISFGLQSFMYEFAKINVIFATTDSYKMFKPLLSRCTEVYFRLYTHDELLKMLSFYLPNVSFKCDNEDLAYACRGRGRDTFLLAENLKRFVRLNNIASIDSNGWANVKDILGIHAKGLTTQEIDYLKILKMHEPISAHSLAIKMGINVQNIESELEIRLRELNMIDNSPRGRCLTNEGNNYLAQLDGKVIGRIGVVKKCLSAQYVPILKTQM